MTEEEADHRCYNRERFKEEAALGLYALMERYGLNRSEVAARIGRSKAFVTKILGGSHNFTLDTLADLFISFGRYPHFSLGINQFEVRDPFDEQPSGIVLTLPSWNDVGNFECWAKLSLV